MSYSSEPDAVVFKTSIISGYFYVYDVLRNVSSLFIMFLPQRINNDESTGDTDASFYFEYDSIFNYSSTIFHIY